MHRLQRLRDLRIGEAGQQALARLGRPDGALAHGLKQHQLQQTLQRQAPARAVGEGLGGDQAEQTLQPPGGRVRGADMNDRGEQPGPPISPCMRFATRAPRRIELPGQGG